MSGGARRSIGNEIGCQGLRRALVPGKRIHPIVARMPAGRWRLKRSAIARYILNRYCSGQPLETEPALGVIPIIGTPGRIPDRVLLFVDDRRCLLEHGAPW